MSLDLAVWPISSLNLAYESSESLDPKWTQQVLINDSFALGGTALISIFLLFCIISRDAPL